MLPSVNSLYSQLLTLPLSLNSHEASTNLINIVADFINQIQAGSSGTPGILTYSRPPAIAILETQQPVSDFSWVTNFANAIEAGVLAGTIAPGTVTNGAWSGSGGSDVETSSSPAATITTLSAAKAVLISDLMNVTYGNNPPMPLAVAIHDYASAFVFLCIGLGPPPPETPIPIPFGAL